MGGATTKVVQCEEYAESCSVYFSTRVQVPPGHSRSLCGLLALRSHGLGSSQGGGSRPAHRSWKSPEPGR